MDNNELQRWCGRVDFQMEAGEKRMGRMEDQLGRMDARLDENAQKTEAALGAVGAKVDQIHEDIQTGACALRIHPQLEALARRHSESFWKRNWKTIAVLAGFFLVGTGIISLQVDWGKWEQAIENLSRLNELVRKEETRTMPSSRSMVAN